MVYAHTRIKVIKQTIEKYKQLLYASLIEVFPSEISAFHFIVFRCWTFFILNSVERRVKNAN